VILAEPTEVASTPSSTPTTTTIEARGFTCPDDARAPLADLAQPWPPAPATSSAPPAGSASAPKTVRWVKMIETGTSIQGPLRPEIIKGTIRRSFGKMRACYEAALARDPRMTGLVATEFLIGRDGRTQWADSRSAGTTVADQEMLSCVERVFACFSFPEPNEPEPGMVFVRYPIAFEQGEGTSP
jgi:hypothetical protein